VKVSMQASSPLQIPRKHRRGEITAEMNLVGHFLRLSYLLRCVILGGLSCRSCCHRRIETVDVTLMSEDWDQRFMSVLSAVQNVGHRVRGAAGTPRKRLEGAFRARFRHLCLAGIATREERDLSASCLTQFPSSYLNHYSNS
jgi:hypothetical protein